MISLSSPVRTQAHDWPATSKIAGLGAATCGLFFLENLTGQVAAFVIVILIYLLPGWQFFRSGLQALWRLWPFVLMLAIFHFVTGTLKEGAIVSLRLISAIGLANLVTMTTPLSEFADSTEFVRPIVRRLGIPPKTLEIVFVLVVRMIPVLSERAQTLHVSWCARSRKRPSWRFILPLFLIALDDANHVADALLARGGLAAEGD